VSDALLMVKLAPELVAPVTVTVMVSAASLKLSLRCVTVMTSLSSPAVISSVPSDGV